MGAAAWISPECYELDKPCIFRYEKNEKGSVYCRILSDSFFDGPCPFRKMNEAEPPEVMKEREGKT